MMSDDLAEAAEEESAADAAPPPSPEALIQRLRRLADNWSAADGYAPSCIEEAADALASSQEALSAYREALEDFRRENMTLRNAAVTAWGLLFDNGIVPQKPPTKVEGS